MSRKPNNIALTVIVFLVVGLFVLGKMKSTCACTEEDPVVASFVSQVKAIESAVTTFRDVYGALPGDLVDVKKLPKCESTECYAGNGDGHIGPRDDSPIKGMRDERRLFWTHLYMADLLGGVAPESSEIVWGKAFPKAKIGGGVHVRHRTEKTPQYFEQLAGKQILGTYLVYSDRTDGDFSNLDVPTYKPIDVASMDRKLDDGRPHSGTIQATGPKRCFSVQSSGVWLYNEDIGEKCISYIFVQVQ